MQEREKCMRECARIVRSPVPKSAFSSARTSIMGTATKSAQTRATHLKNVALRMFKRSFNGFIEVFPISNKTLVKIAIKERETKIKTFPALADERRESGIKQGCGVLTLSTNAKGGATLPV